MKGGEEERKTGKGEETSKTESEEYERQRKAVIFSQQTEVLHFTLRQSLVQLTCSLTNSCGDCSSCMRGGTPSRTVRVCKEEPEAILVRTHAASNWREGTDGW